MKLSLCIITGNNERYIRRFLNSFSFVVDEIVIVRAIGFQEPDDTMKLVESWSRNHDTPVVSLEYKNKPSHYDWPHVDNFAAARQMAFDAATNDWIMWADTDDIIDADTQHLIRHAFEKHHADYDAFAVDYLIPEDGLTVQKERIVRKSAGAWRYPIHEEFKFIGDAPRIIRIDQALVVHSPQGSRKTNDERNLRILRSMKRDGTLTVGHQFHLVQSLRATGQASDSTAEAVNLLKQPDLGIDERYELLMNLAETCPNRADQGNIYLQAIGVNPHRREAYGELALWSVITARFTHALGFSTAMMGLPKPKEYMWNLRQMYYGWMGIKLHAMALRVNGHQYRADVLQYNHFKKHGSKISLLHATRGRAAMAYKAQHKWLTLAADPDSIEHIFAIDSDDESGIALACQNAVIVPPGGGCVRAWNMAAAKSSGAVLVQMSDDFTPPLHWDQLILDRIGDLSASSVLAVSDGHRTDDLLCMAILTRARYNQQGFMFHPDFEVAAMYSDNYFTYRAAKDGVIIEARDLIFEHAHPAFGKAPMDATYAAQNAPEKYEKGKAIYDRLTA